MQKEVLIHVRGLQMMDAQSDQEPIEIVVPGQYYFRNGFHYLRYEEILDESSEPTVNYIKMSERGLEVSKKGLVNVHMVFEQGKKNMTYYNTDDSGMRIYYNVDFYVDGKLTKIASAMKQTNISLDKYILPEQKQE